MRDVAFVLALGLYASIQTAVSFKFLSTRRSVIHSQGLSGLRSTSLKMVSTPHGGKVPPIYKMRLQCYHMSCFTSLRAMSRSKLAILLIFCGLTLIISWSILWWLTTAKRMT